MANCETNGHLWGPLGACVMCKTPRPLEHPSSKKGFVCADCKNVFLQEPRCTTCGAEKLYDTTVRSLQEDNARYENGRVILLNEIEDLKTKLSARLQQIDELKLQLVEAQKLAVRQGNEIRKLRSGERA